MNNLTPTTNQVARAKRFLESRSWYETERDWTHPDHPDDFFSLRDAYHRELALVVIGEMSSVTKGDA